MIYKYDARLIDMALLPIFIRLRPNNMIELRLKANFPESNLKALEDLMSSEWFTNLRKINANTTRDDQKAKPAPLPSSSGSHQNMDQVS